MTASSKDDPGARRQPARRFFSDEEKHTIALESDQPGVSVSQVARKHGIVTGMLFRWRVQFGVAQKKLAKLAPVALTDGTPAALLLCELMQPPDGMTAIDLLTADASSRLPAAIRAPFASMSKAKEQEHDDGSRRREGASGAGLTDMRKVSTGSPCGRSKR